MKTMTISQLEKLMLVNPFGNKVEVDKKPENIVDVKLEISEKVNSMFEKYKKACPHIQTSSYYAFKYVSRLKLDVLSPSEIDLFLQHIIMKTKIRDGFPWQAGVMISRLINDSYNAGNNNFTLTINDCIIYELFSNVHGTMKNPVIATVCGYAGGFFGSQSEYCTIDVKGNADFRFGAESKHCTYTIYGDASPVCGFMSEDCIYHIMGEVELNCGANSKNSIYNINGDAGGNLGSSSKECTYNICGKIKAPIGEDIKNSIFKILNKKNYDLLVQKLPATNTIQLLDSAGRMIMETRK